MSLTKRSKEIYQLSMNIKALMNPFRRFSCLGLFWAQVTFQEKNYRYITKWPPYFHLLCKWKHSNVVYKTAVGATDFVHRVKLWPVNLFLGFWSKDRWLPCTTLCICDLFSKNKTIYRMLYFKVPMKWKIICAYLKGLSKYRRVVFIFLKYLFLS